MQTVPRLLVAAAATVEVLLYILAILMSEHQIGRC